MIKTNDKIDYVALDKINPTFLVEPGMWVEITLDGTYVEYVSATAKATAAIVIKGIDSYHNDGKQRGAYLLHHVNAIVDTNVDLFDFTIGELDVPVQFTIDDGHMRIAQSGDKVFANLITKNAQTGDFRLTLLEPNILTAAISGGSEDPAVVISPDLDKNFDGIVTAKEILDVDSDGDTDIHDLIRMVNNGVTD